MNLTLEQVIKFARATDLKNFAVINNYDELIQILNLVLIELHARFTLKQDIMTIPLSADKTTYKLTDYLKEEEVTKAEMDTIIESVNATLTQKTNELTEFVNTSVTTLSDTVEQYLQKIDHIPDNLAESLNSINTKLSDIETAITDLPTLKTTVEEHTTKLEEISNSITQNNTVFLSTVDELKTRLDTLDTSSGTASTTLNDLTTKVDAATTNITTLTTDVSTIKTDVSQLKTDVAANTTLASSKIGYKTYSADTAYGIGDLILEAGAVYLVTTSFTSTGVFADDAANYKAL